MKVNVHEPGGKRLKIFVALFFKSGGWRGGEGRDGTSLSVCATQMGMVSFKPFCNEKRGYIFWSFGLKSG